MRKMDDAWRVSFNSGIVLIVLLSLNFANVKSQGKNTYDYFTFYISNIAVRM